MPEELNPGISTDVVAPVSTVPAETAPTSSADVLKQAAELDRKLSQGESLTPSEPAPVAASEEPKPETQTEAPKVDIAAILKEHGFGEDSLEGVKRHQDKLMARDETFHYLSKNVPGFTDWATRQIMRSQGILEPDANDTLANLEKPKNQPTATKPETAPPIYDYFKDRINAITGDSFTKEEIDSQVELFEAIARNAGYVKKDELAAIEQSREQEKLTQEADARWKGFPNNPNVKKQLEAMGMTWDGENAAKPHIARMLVTRFRVSDISQVSDQDLAYAWNQFLFDNIGGADKIISNAQTETLKSITTKEQLPKPVTPQSSVSPGTKATLTLDDILNNPDPDPSVQGKRILEYAALLDSQKRRR